VIGSFHLNGKFKCARPGCARKFFARQAELKRHYDTIHAMHKPAYWFYTLLLIFHKIRRGITASTATGLSILSLRTRIVDAGASYSDAPQRMRTTLLFYILHLHGNQDLLP
jgi:hypothetical protein